MEQPAAAGAGDRFAFGGSRTAIAGIVALTFTRHGSEGGLPRVFALAACFGLAVFIGLGGMDGLTRHDILVHAPPP